MTTKLSMPTPAAGRSNNNSRLFRSTLLATKAAKKSYGTNAVAAANSARISGNPSGGRRQLNAMDVAERTPGSRAARQPIHNPDGSRNQFQDAGSAALPANRERATQPRDPHLNKQTFSPVANNGNFLYTAKV